MSPSSARRRVAPLLVPLLAVGLLVAGCTGSGEDEQPPEAAPSTLAEVDADAQVARIEFCELVPDDAVAEALGGEPEDELAWVPGDEVGGRPVQETGCSWTAGTTTASAWVFARPMDEQAARRAVRQARGEQGCRTTRAGGIGDPSLRQECPVPDQAQQARVRHAGLLGDTWLSCELTGPRAEARDRSEAWCARLVEALDTGA